MTSEHLLMLMHNQPHLLPVREARGADHPSDASRVLLHVQAADHNVQVLELLALHGCLAPTLSAGFTSAFRQVLAMQLRLLHAVVGSLHVEQHPRGVRRAAGAAGEPHGQQVRLAVRKHEQMFGRHCTAQRL